MRWSFLGLGVGSLLAACAIDAPLTSTSSHDIIGGTLSNNASVVMLVGYPPSESVIHACTAVIVSPTVALTAAHCVDAPTHPDYSFGLFTGADAGDMMLADYKDDLVPVESVHPHPQYSPDLPFYADIAVVRLATATSIVPLPINREPLTQAVVGQLATIVGYGQTVYDEFNQTRYEATVPVVSLETAANQQDTIVVGDAKRSCLGDSGGPAILDGVVIGVDSYGPTGCGAPAHYRRTDSFVPFLDMYVPPPAQDPDPEEPEDPGDGGGDGGDGGGCSAGHASSPLALVLGLVTIALRRRRR